MAATGLTLFEREPITLKIKKVFSNPILKKSFLLKCILHHQLSLLTRDKFYITS